MRIGIDGRHINGSGIGTYVLNLIKEFQNKNVDINVYCKSNQINNFLDFSIKTTRFDCNIYSIKEQVESIITINGKNHDLLHWPHYNIPLGYNAPLVTTIHDIIHLKFPQFLPNKAAYYYAYFMISQALRKSKKIITVSNHTKQDLLKTFKVNEDKITVIYNGVSKEFNNCIDHDLIKKVKKEYNIEKPYILFIGNVRAHKNILRLIRAFKGLKSVCSGYKLVIIGEEHKNLKGLEVDKDILLLGYVENQKLPAFYAGASLFVFPTLYEGFGLPPLEAMACGTPVITSNISSLPEVVGDAAIKVNPYSVEEIVKAMYSVLTNKEISRKLVYRGLERVKLFCWEKTANQTLNVYKEVLRGVNKI